MPSAMKMLHGLGSLLLVLLVLEEAAFGAAQGNDLGKGKQHEQLAFRLPQPTERFKSKGGKLSVWPEDSDALRQANLRPKLVVLETNGLFLPKYSNAPELCYVLGGRAWAGLVRPTGKPTNIRYVRTGDLLAIPRGWVSWLWNTGPSRLELVCVAETSDIMSPENYLGFFLAGAEGGDMGGFLHGFTPDVLEMVWNLKEEEVKEIIQSQKDKGIVFSNLKPAKDSLVAETETANLQTHGDFAFNLLAGRPSLEERGGWITIVDSQRLPVLEKMGLGAFVAKLEHTAMFSPQWIDCSQVLYVSKGKGRVEMAYPNGTQALEEEVKRGDLIVIPDLFPHTMISTEEEGMEWISFFASSTWKSSTLAGSESVFGDIPSGILAAAFNVSPDLQSEIFSHPREESLMFPSYGGGGGGQA